MKEEKYKRVYYIIFENIPVYKVWKIFLSNRINHCYAVTAVTKGSSIVINQTEKGLYVDAYRRSSIDIVECCIKKGRKVLRAEVEFRSPNISNKLFSRSCVGICKELLGINKPFMFTPMQLYDYLKRREDV